ncbi:MAG: HAMP domain-containing sensor histidine kinase [Spirochaetales bacterium]|nr:HAMP domain-containing sensor histidine kinase [Spirochaetales bacterium]
MMRSLTTRLLFFNLLLVFFPIGGMMLLDTYEKQLLDSMERSMVQQGRIISAALSGRALEEESIRILTNLEGKIDSRIRIVNTEGLLIADSSSPDLYSEPVNKTVSKSYRYYSESEEQSIRENWLYKVAVYPLKIFRRIFLPPTPLLGSAEYYSKANKLDGPEIRAALNGRYGAWTRYSSGGQRSVNLYSAIPIRTGNNVNGAVLVSRSTYKILTDLYSIRLDMVKVFLFSLIAAVGLSLILAKTITIPVKKLRVQAESFIDHRGRLTGEFKQLENRDEIGDLSRSLYTLSTRLEEYISFINAFSADISHELKNPVAAIRSAAELAEFEAQEEQNPMFEIIKKETGRIQRLLDDLRDISRVDASLENEERQLLEPKSILGNLIAEWDGKSKRKDISFTFLDLTEKSDNLKIEVSEQRLYQCISNLLDNAESFSPPNSQITLHLSKKAGMAVIEVKDEGPGIPEGMTEKIFNRFYTDRDERQKAQHSGLGLSIVKAITEGYGGKITASNNKNGGACFRLELPSK